MTHHRYIGIITSAGVISWIALFLVLTKMSPYESMGPSLTFFFITLFIALTTSLTALGFYFRLWFFKNEIFYKHINVSLRQGVFLSLVAVFSLVFQMIKVLTWWSGILLVSAAVLLEFYFSSKDSEFS